MAVSDSVARKYGIVVLGGSGFTGTMVCMHIAAKFPTNLKWAVAGRSRERLEKLASNLRKEYPNRIQPGENMQSACLESPTKRLTGVYKISRLLYRMILRLSNI